MKGKLSRFAFKNPDTVGLSDILTEAEQSLAHFDEVLDADRLKRENEVRRAAAEREEARKQLEEKEAARVAEELKERALYEKLAKQYGGSSGLTIHTMVRTFISLPSFQSCQRPPCSLAMAAIVLGTPAKVPKERRALCARKSMHPARSVVSDHSLYN